MCALIITWGVGALRAAAGIVAATAAAIRRLGCLAAVLIVAVLPGCVTGVPIAEHAKPGVLPIVDFHNHLNGDMKAEELLAVMDRSGVRTMVLMPRHYANPRDAGYASDEQAARYAAEHPGRFVAFIGGQRGDLSSLPDWIATVSVDSFLEEAEAKLKSGDYRGLGEFILYHHAYTLRSEWGQTGGEVNISPDTPLMRGIARLAAAHSVPVVMHLEAEPEQTRQAIRLFSTNPPALFVWAHNCGRASAAQIGQLLSRFPHLMCDLGNMMVPSSLGGGYGRYWPKWTPYIHLVQEEDGTVRPEMLALFEAFSDRFMLGTDTAHTPVLAYYEDKILAFRQMLSQMTPRTARRIAYENADRILNLRAQATR